MSVRQRREKHPSRPKTVVFQPLRYKQEKGKCKTGKLRYPTALDAGIALGRAQSGRPVKGRDAKVETRHYFCSECKGHHLTSVPQKPA